METRLFTSSTLPIAPSICKGSKRPGSIPTPPSSRASLNCGETRISMCRTDISTRTGWCKCSKVRRAVRWTKDFRSAGCSVRWTGQRETPRISSTSWNSKRGSTASRQSHDDAVICFYDLAKFGGEAIVDIMRTHPMVIIGGLRQENPFYVPPAQFLTELRERKASRKSLQSLDRRSGDGATRENRR